ncbi:hypothetical protein M433DRAFT_374188 [Acidomyces richmondensis BFW]|nr:MAG: hypothetical protein FE78DRAFT_510069 [Acidomyces sp. 'richmondensis']KYG43083.1 hypothetical protein M433DRAFT_374188 [Acidomyces richmondensis BFW]
MKSDSSHLSIPTNSREHDLAASSADKSKPTLIYVCNDVTPGCRNFTPRFETLAREWQPKDIQFCLLEFNDETSRMFKVILWCTALISPLERARLFCNKFGPISYQWFALLWAEIWRE